jgi:hypothetical protein
MAWRKIRRLIFLGNWIYVERKDLKREKNRVVKKKHL